MFFNPFGWAFHVWILFWFWSWSFFDSTMSGFFIFGCVLKFSLMSTMFQQSVSLGIIVMFACSQYLMGKRIFLFAKKKYWENNFWYDGKLIKERRNEGMCHKCNRDTKIANLFCQFFTRGWIKNKQYLHVEWIKSKAKWGKFK